MITFTDKLFAMSTDMWGLHTTWSACLTGQVHLELGRFIFFQASAGSNFQMVGLHDGSLG